MNTQTINIKVCQGGGRWEYYYKKTMEYERMNIALSIERVNYQDYQEENPLLPVKGCAWIDTEAMEAVRGSVEMLYLTLGAVVIQTTYGSIHTGRLLATVNDRKTAMAVWTIATIKEMQKRNLLNNNIQKKAEEVLDAACSFFINTGLPFWDKTHEDYLPALMLREQDVFQRCNTEDDLMGMILANAVLTSSRYRFVSVSVMTE